VSGWERTGDYAQTAGELAPIAAKFRAAGWETRIVKNRGAMRSSGKGWESNPAIARKRYYLESRR
jgi:hypothetical protein